LPEIRHSVCALDCPDACSLLINVENGKGSRLRGNPEHSVTRGFLCGKVARYLEREYSPDRLLYPQKRIGAKAAVQAPHRWNARFPSSDGMSTAQGIRADPFSESPTIQTKVRAAILKAPL
jgi:hypothetical protein